MHDDLNLFENELKEVKPRRMSDSLKDRIACEVNIPVQVGHSDNQAVHWFTRSGLLYAGMAAALLVALGSWYLAVNRNGDTILPGNDGISTVSQHEDVPPEMDRSVTADTYLLRSTDEGIIFADNSRPMRKIKCSLLDTVQWDEPEDNSKYRIMNARNVIAYVPVMVD